MKWNRFYKYNQIKHLPSIVHIFLFELHKYKVTSVSSQWIHKTVVALLCPFLYYHNSWYISNGAKHRQSHAKPSTTIAQSIYFISFIQLKTTIFKVAINSKLDLFFFVIYYQLRHTIIGLVSTIHYPLTFEERALYLISSLKSLVCFAQYETMATRYIRIYLCCYYFRMKCDYILQNNMRFQGKINKNSIMNLKFIYFFYQISIFIVMNKRSIK